jgi:hypothetical protein
LANLASKGVVGREREGGRERMTLADGLNISLGCFPFFSLLSSFWISSRGFVGGKKGHVNEWNTYRY